MTRTRHRSPNRQRPRSGRQSNTSRVPWWRRPPLAWAGGIATTLVVAIVTAFGTNIGQSLSAGQHPSSSVEPPAIGSLAITESQRDLQFTVPVFNPKPFYQQIQEVGLDIGWSKETVVCPASSEPLTYVYNVGENLAVEKRDNAVFGSITPASGVDAGSATQARGRISAECEGGISDLNLTFSPPALILAGNSTTIMVIKLPETISVKALSPSSFSPDLPASPISLPSIIITSAHKSAHYFFMRATVSILTNTGIRMSACKELDSISIKPQKCSNG